MPFQKGNQAAKGHGRPPKAREAALLAIAHEILNAQNWRQVVTKRLLDALGKKEGMVNGQRGIIDDPESTAQGRNQAAVFLRDTVIGKPTEYLNLDASESPYEFMTGYSEEELEQIRDLLGKLRPDSGGGEPGLDGVGAPPAGPDEPGTGV